MSDDAFDPDDMNDADWPSVRASLRDVVVPADAREAAIAAALGEFDELRATPATVVSLASRRKRQYRMLSYAAAAVAVLFVGGVIVRNGRSTSTPAMSASEKSAAATASPAMASATESTVAGQVAAQTLSGATDTALSQSPSSAADATGTTSNGAPLVVVATIGAIPGPAEAGGTAVSATAVAEQVATPDINSPEALASYARTLAEAGPSLMQGDSCPPTAATTLGTVNYRGHLAVVRRASDGTITAVDLASCAVLATTAP